MIIKKNAGIHGENPNKTMENPKILKAIKDKSQSSVVIGGRKSITQKTGTREVS